MASWDDIARELCDLPPLQQRLLLTILTREESHGAGISVDRLMEADRQTRRTRARRGLVEQALSKLAAQGLIRDRHEGEWVHPSVSVPDGDGVRSRLVDRLESAMSLSSNKIRSSGIVGKTPGQNVEETLRQALAARDRQNVQRGFQLLKQARTQALSVTSSRRRAVLTRIRDMKLDLLHVTTQHKLVIRQTDNLLSELETIDADDDAAALIHMLALRGIAWRHRAAIHDDPTAMSRSIEEQKTALVVLDSLHSRGRVDLAAYESLRRWIAATAAGAIAIASLSGDRTLHFSEDAQRLLETAQNLAPRVLDGVATDETTVLRARHQLLLSGGAEVVLPARNGLPWLRSWIALTRADELAVRGEIQTDDGAERAVQHLETALKDAHRGPGLGRTLLGFVDLKIGARALAWGLRAMRAESLDRLATVAHALLRPQCPCVTREWERLECAFRGRFDMSKRPLERLALFY